MVCDIIIKLIFIVLIYRIKIYRIWVSVKQEVRMGGRVGAIIDG